MGIMQYNWLNEKEPCKMDTCVYYRQSWAIFKFVLLQLINPVV